MKHTKGNFMVYGPNGERRAAFALDSDRKLFEVTPDLLEAAKHFFEWHAEHFEDFDKNINSELLCLANEFEQAIAKAEGSL